MYSYGTSYYIGEEAETYSQCQPLSTLSQFITSVNCKSYVERANLYLAVNNIADVNKQLAVFLSSCKDATYRRIKDVLLACINSDLPLIQPQNIFKECQPFCLWHPPIFNDGHFYSEDSTTILPISLAGIMPMPTL